MASGVRVTDFISVEHSLVKDKLKWAPQTLTAAERDWVPEVAKDNFDRALNARGGSIDKGEFLSTFTGYVASLGYTFDKNNNGILSAVDAKQLPADLKDNFKDAVRVVHGADWKQASNAALAQAGREALTKYVEKVIFNPRNPEGASFRSDLLDHLTPAQREAAHQRMLAEAAAFDPASPDWSMVDFDTRTVAAEGRFYELYCNLFFEKGLTLPKVLVEVD
jgi:hypothetical protein